MNSLDVMKAALLAGAALLAAAPAQAQDERRAARQEYGERIERADRRAERQALPQAQAQAQAQVRAQPQPRGEWAARRDVREGGAMIRARPEVTLRQTEEQPALRRAPVEEVRAAPARSYGADRNTTYTAPRDRSYGADARARGRGEGTPGVQPQPTVRQGNDGAWSRERQQYPGGGNWSRSDQRGDRPQTDWRRDQRDDRRDDRRTDRRDERRDDARNYARGYRDGARADTRYGRDYRSWDRRQWRNDNRYDWYRYRAANRSIFSLGRYYAPYRNYSYSRISIGVRLGSLFYSNRYWINDPWRYRLPDVYGPYRWVRYYDDALLVDIYSGEVVDVIHDFFW